jgi:magnesium-transporting ATPase (P-type)
VTATRSADLVETGGPLIRSRDLVFSGTACTGGEARALVFATGLPLSDSVVFAIGLIVGNVPEGLLPVITLALATGCTSGKSGQTAASWTSRHLPPPPPLLLRPIPAYRGQGPPE